MDKTEKIKEMIYELDDEFELYDLGSTCFVLAQYLEKQKKTKK